MCLEDVRIGRRTTGQLINKAVTITPSQLVGEDRDRRTLIISADAATAYLIGFKAGDNTQPGILIPAASGPHKFSVDKDGDFVTRALWVFTAAGTATAGAYIGQFEPESLRG